jgi:hypothetical protein
MQQRASKQAGATNGAVYRARKSYNGEFSVRKFLCHKNPLGRILMSGKNDWSYQLNHTVQVKIRCE